MVSEHVTHDVQVDSCVAVNEHVSQSDSSTQRVSKRLIDPGSLLKQAKQLLIGARFSEPLVCDDMQRDILNGLQHTCTRFRKNSDTCRSMRSFDMTENYHGKRRSTRRPLGRRSRLDLA